MKTAFQEGSRSATEQAPRTHPARRRSPAPHSTRAQRFWILLGSGLLITASNLQAQSPTGQWDFDSGDLSATVGEPLEYRGGSQGPTAQATTFGSTTSFGLPPINGAAAKVMRFSGASSSALAFIMRHGIAPNSGGTKVNQWTLLMDILVPNQSNEPWLSFIQIDDPSNNANDGELFARWDGGIAGIGITGQYSGAAARGQWHRIAFAVDASTVISKFINGTKVADQTTWDGIGLDGRHALFPTALLFGDEDGESQPVFVNSIQIRGYKMSDAEIQALGGPSAAGIPRVGFPAALHFDGANDVISSDAGPVAVPWTAELWVNREDSPVHSSVLLADSATALKLEQWSASPCPKSVGFTKFGSNDWCFNYTAPIGTWIHLAFVGTPTNTQLYVNGTLQATVAATIPLPLAQVGSDGAGDRLKGVIDDLRVWSVARTEAEILSTMNRPLTGAEPNLVAYWRFDEAGGAKANDSSGHGYTATLNGPAWTAGLITVPVFLNEWLTDNLSGKMDNLGQRDPWLELYNASANAIELAGYSLTDDLNNPTKFLLPPNTIVPGRGWLLIWADAQPGQTTVTELHANFRLAPEGGALALFSPTGALVDAVRFGPQQVDVTQGRCPDGSTLIRTLSTPTPATANNCSGAGPIPLVITRPPLSQTVGIGGTARFLVMASGPEPLRYQWRWNGAVLREQTNAVLVLSDVQPTNSGVYSAVVAGGDQTLASSAAFLIVPAGISYTMTDPFAGGPFVTASSSMTETNNAAATAQTGESLHADRPGGKSMWLAWTSSVPGVVTFSTHGSDFDTLLAAYRGPSVSSLTNLAAADDSDGLLTSTIRFSPPSDAITYIAVDGFYGATGRIVLSWSFVETPFAAPVILSTPTNRSVLQGDSTTFSVTASNAIRYQWFFNGNPIPSATSSSYSIASVQPAHIGYYFLRAANINSNVSFVNTIPTLLEIGAFSPHVSRSKREDALADPPPINGLLARGPEIAAVNNASGLVSVAAGSLYVQMMTTAGTVPSITPASCDAGSISTRWWAIRPTDGGMTCVLSTEGSQVPAVLAVFVGGVRGYSEVLCAIRPTGKIRFPAEQTNYSIALDSTTLETGLLTLNYGLGMPPFFVRPPASTNFINGTTGILSVDFSGKPTPSLQWQESNAVNRGFTIISGATQPVYQFIASQTAHYRVVAENFVDTVTSAVALVTVQMPPIPPVITVQPQSLAVPQGGTAAFSVTAEGSPPLAYAWQFNGTNIAGATNSMYTNRAVQCAHAGAYSVRVSNPGGSVTSSNAQLVVLCPPPPTLVIQPAPTSPRTYLLSWSDSSASYMLQAADALAWPLSATVWTNLGQSSSNLVAFPTNAARFYRLICPCRQE